MPCTTHFLSSGTHAEFLFSTAEQRRLNVFVFQRTFSGKTRHVLISSIFSIYCQSFSHGQIKQNERVPTTWRARRKRMTDRLNKLVIRIKPKWILVCDSPLMKKTLIQSHTRIDYIRWMRRIKNQHWRKRKARLSSTKKLCCCYSCRPV